MSPYAHPGAMARTHAQRSGDAAEQAVSERLARIGWSILGRNVRVGRAELDIVAVDPGPPVRLVVVEVRWRSRHDFGFPEETVGREKLGRLRAALGVLLGTGHLPDGAPLPRASPAIDVVAVQPGTGVALRLRHHRDVG